MIRKEDTYYIGIFSKTHGVDGYLLLTSKYDFPSFKPMDFVFCRIDGLFIPFMVEDQALHTARAMALKLADVNDRTAAQKMVGLEVYFPRDKVNSAADPLSNETGWGTLIGLRIENEAHQPVGEIVDVDARTENVLFRVETTAGECWIPAHRELIAQYDPERGTITMTLPDGLLDVNLSGGQDMKDE